MTIGCPILPWDCKRNKLILHLYRSIEGVLLSELHFIIVGDHVLRGYAEKCLT